MIWMNAECSPETMETRRWWSTISDKGKPRELVPSKPVLTEILREVLQTQEIIPDGNLDLQKGTKGTRKSKHMGKNGKLFPFYIT